MLRRLQRAPIRQKLMLIAMLTTGGALLLAGLAIVYYALNASRPLFASARMRRAVNFAIDRRALANAQQAGYGALPTDQYVPPLIAGFRDAHIYPLDKPDLVRARKLAGRGTRKAVLYTCDNPDCLKQAQVLTRNLAAIGIRLDVHAFSENELFLKETAKSPAFDLASTNQTTDGYFDPSDFLNVVFESKGEFNRSHFSDPVYDRRLEAAAKLTGTARYRTYARLDAQLARNAAPILIWGNGAYRDFFSARIGCQIYRPSIDLAALCVRGSRP